MVISIPDGSNGEIPALSCTLWYLKYSDGLVKCKLTHPLEPAYPLGPAIRFNW